MESLLDKLLDVLGVLEALQRLEGLAEEDAVTIARAFRFVYQVGWLVFYWVSCPSWEVSGCEPRGGSRNGSLAVQILICLKKPATFLVYRAPLCNIY